MSDANAGAKVLVVDDSRAIRQILGRALAEAGYQVLQAGNSQEGLEVARGATPAVDAAGRGHAGARRHVHAATHAR